jgi:dCTP deaminase
MVKNDRWIRDMAQKGMIHPFDGKKLKKGVISYGVSSYGYDMRIADEFKIFSPVGNPIVDPKNFDAKNLADFRGDICIVPPHTFVLAKSFEYFRIPRDVLVICLGKSTYARCGIVINVTPLEPEWEGYITIAISNTGPLPARLYAHEGIGQLVFLQSSEICETSYADKRGKYQAQKKITLAKIR